MRNREELSMVYYASLHDKIEQIMNYIDNIQEPEKLTSQQVKKMCRVLEHLEQAVLVAR